MFANHKILTRYNDKRHFIDWNNFATFFFDSGLTFLICSIALLVYKVIDIIAPLLFVFSLWFFGVVYKLKDGDKGTKLFTRFSDNYLWIIIELIFISLILFDWFGFNLL